MKLRPLAAGSRAPRGPPALRRQPASRQPAHEPVRGRLRWSHSSGLNSNPSGKSKALLKAVVARMEKRICARGDPLPHTWAPVTLPWTAGRIPGGTRVLLVGSPGPRGAPPSAFAPDGFFLLDRLQLAALGSRWSHEPTGRSAPRHLRGCRVLSQTSLSCPVTPGTCAYEKLRVVGDEAGPRVPSTSHHSACAPPAAGAQSRKPGNHRRPCHPWPQSRSRAAAAQTEPSSLPSRVQPSFQPLLTAAPR